jgi:hypothetical protein
MQGRLHGCKRLKLYGTEFLAITEAARFPRGAWE